MSSAAPTSYSTPSAATAPSSTPTKVWATLLTRTNYLQGALVLEHSLRKVGSKYPLVVFATSELPKVARDVLTQRGIRISDIDYLEPPRDKQKELDEHDLRFRDTWTKLQAFALTEYERLVLLDSDMLVVRNMDELLEDPLEEGWIAAAHACTCNPKKLAHYPSDWIPENCGHTRAKLTTPLPASQFTLPTHSRLNSGLVVLRPSASTFSSIVSFLHTDPRVATYGFPDQDLLADFFEGRFRPLSYRYNALKTLRYAHEEMWRDEDVKNVHYILKKPWQYKLPREDRDGETSAWWWTAFDELEASWGNAPHWDVIEAQVNRELRRPDQE